MASACPVPGPEELLSDEYKTGDWAGPWKQPGLMPVGSMCTMAVD